MDHSKSDWYEEMTRELQINGKSLRTQQACTRAVRQLVVDHYHKAPEEIFEQELQDYFLFRRNTSKWAPKTLRICYSGIKFYYQLFAYHFFPLDPLVFGVSDAVNTEQGNRLRQQMKIVSLYQYNLCYRDIAYYSNCQ